MFRIAARPAALQNLGLYTQGHSNYDINIAETNKYQSHRGHILYSMKNKNEDIQKHVAVPSRISGLPGIIHIYINTRYKCT